jgi:hypothetical protein
MITSNLTFGAGGKDKDGNNIAGWGYYEVIRYLCLASLKSIDFIRLTDNRRRLRRWA